MLLAASGASAQLSPPIPSARPGVIRIWGNAQMEAVVRSWSDAFRIRNPGIRVETNLSGSDVAMAALYTDTADMVLLGREAAEMESKAFEWIYRYPPTEVEVMTGSVGTAGKSPAVAVLVHKSNPLKRISFDELRAVFGQGDASVWGELGLDGAWTSRTIRLYAPHAESGTGKFFRQKVLNDSNKMAWDRLTEFSEPVVKGPYVDRAGRDIAEALAQDPAGIAIGNAGDVTPDVRVMPLSVSGAGAFLPTRVTVGDRSYPLSRAAYAYVNRAPGKPADPEVAAFLRFVLSPEGQRIVERGGYLPLDSEHVAEARRAIE
jgi:phosphate transport system substrate-binding protein